MEKSVLLKVWLISYMLGFIGYLAIPPLTGLLTQTILQLFRSELLAGAFITGLATSIIAVTSTTLWMYLSK